MSAFFLVHSSELFINGTEIPLLGPTKCHFIQHLTFFSIAQNFHATGELFISCACLNTSNLKSIITEHIDFGLLAVGVSLQSIGSSMTCTEHLNCVLAA